jgi:cell division protein FtsB
MDQIINTTSMIRVNIKSQKFFLTLSLILSICISLLYIAQIQKIKKLELKSSQQQSSINDLEGRINELENENSTLQNNIDDLEGRIGDLETTRYYFRVGP